MAFYLKVLSNKETEDLVKQELNRMNRELTQIKEHIEQFREVYNGDEGYKLLETMLINQLKSTRDEWSYNEFKGGLNE